jgi:hypothetical protein
MPNVGSWNGKWTGADRKYYVIEKISDKYMKSKDHFKELLEKKKDSWHYSWNDGWGANVKAEIIDAAEAKKRRKISAGFCGYDWMIDTIKWYGAPMNTAEVKRHLESEKQTA